jgi:hypothetical protein
MSRAAMSMFVFGIYLFGLGAILLIAPNVLLGIFGLEPATDVFVRSVGMLVVFLGYYYVSAARGEVVPFMRWSVRARPFVIAFFIAFVALGWSKPQLILFGAVELAAAIWTHLALRASGAAPPA